MVNMVKTKAEFDSIVKDNMKVAVDFTASWCGPCKMIGPKFEAFAASADYSGIIFIKVDVDENADTAEAAGVTAMPTFHFYFNGKRVDDLVGASEGKLKEKLDELKVMN